jgi:predicted ATP-dependent endonuclease of OLD family
LSNQHIVRVQAQNFKNVRALDITPNRYLTKISGANEAGKTSALDSIFYGLLGRKTLPANLIRQGQRKGHITIETTTHLITRTLDEKGGSLQIEVKATGNLLKAPDDWLEGIAGSLGFDPLKFMRMKPEDQFQTLKQLVPVAAEVDDLEVRNDADAETITRRKAEAKRLEAARDHINFDKALPAEPIDVGELLKHSREAADFNQQIERDKRQREDNARALAQIERSTKDRAERLRVLREEIEAIETAMRQEIDRAQALMDEEATWKPLPEPRDRSAIDTQITEANLRNQAISTNNANKAQRESFEGQVDAIKTEITKLEEEVRNRKLAIAKALDTAQFPVPGLSFETMAEGSGGRERKNPKKTITYHGVPLADASTAQQIRVSTAIGMANKPELRFLLIREGSLLDDGNLAILEEMAHENDFQILMEVVDTSGKVGIFMEEGAVKSVNAEPEPEAAPVSIPAKKKAKKEKASV